MKIFILLFTISTAFIINTKAQEIFPGGIPGTGGSYNLTFPAGNCFVANRPIGNNNTGAITKGSSYTGPFQTHQWWNTALWNVSYLSATQNLHSGVMHPHPLILEAVSDGLIMRHRNKDYQAGAIDINYFTSDVDLKVGLSGRTSPDTKVESYGHWHVKMLQQTGGGNDLYMTAAAGSPYVFFDIQGSAQPIINGGNMKIFASTSNSLGIISNTNSVSYPDKYFALILPAGATVSLGGAAYTAPGSIATNTNASDIKINLPSGKDFFSVGLLPINTLAALTLFTDYGLNFITNTDFSYSYNESTAKVTSTFTYTTIARDGTVNEGTLQALYRHQYLYSPEASTSSNTGYTYMSPRGSMKLLSGNIFTTEMVYYGSLPMLAKANKADQTKLYNLCTDFAASSQIINPATLNYDMYNTFIAISQAGRMAEVANEVGNYSARNKALDAAKFWIEAWLRSPNGEVCQTTHFSPVFNWLTCYPDAFQADIGIHDSHFMYGYLIHGAATVARFEKRRFGNMNWVNNWKPMIDLMVRNIDDWNKTCLSAPNDGNNPCFPYLRYFDPYAGHSWALNYTESQESISEAVQFAAAVAQWGEVTDNPAMRDMGIMIFVHESECGRQYWYDVDNAGINKGPFAMDYPYNHAGIVFTWGAKYGTFFGTQPYQIHGITYWAISGASVWMGKDVPGIQKDYTDFISANGGNMNGTNTEGYWTTELLSAMALFNAGGAATRFNSTVLYNDAVFNVNAEMRAYRTIAYHWISTLDSVGQVDATVQTNTAFYSVFYKNNCRHYMVYNPPNKAGKTVNFTDGKSFFVPSDTLMVVKDCNLSGLPVEFASFTIRATGKNAYLYWQTANEVNNRYFIIEKSKDGEFFFPIDTIYPDNNSGSIQNYFYIDKNPAIGIIYYQIKQQDLDGNFSYSKIRNISMNEKSTDHSLFKKVYNDPDGTLLVKLINTSTIRQEVEIRIIDVRGEEFLKIRQILDGTAELSVSGKEIQLPAGIYIIQSLNDFVRFR
jgi:endoglucanase Acf2